MCYKSLECTKQQARREAEQNQAACANGPCHRAGAGCVHAVQLTERRVEKHLYVVLSREAVLLVTSSIESAALAFARYTGRPSMLDAMGMGWLAEILDSKHKHPRQIPSTSGRSTSITAESPPECQTSATRHCKDVVDADMGCRSHPTPKYPGRDNLVM